MALLDSEFSFTGSLGELSAYRMRGTDKVVIRRKGGASKNQIKTSPAFVNTRRMNMEFGGRAFATKWIMHMLAHFKPLADYNIAGPLNALLKPAQDLDTVNNSGERSVLLSQKPHLLDGFSLNRKITFESVVPATLSHELSRETLSAQIQLPELIPGFNFHAPKYPWYRFIAGIGIVPDFVFATDRYDACHPDYSLHMNRQLYTPWLPVLNGGKATSLELQIPHTLPDENFSIILCIGIAFGNVVNEREITQVKYAGCAKVLAVG